MGTNETRSIHIRKMQKLKNPWVYTGSIENGMDLMQLRNDF
jgi:hypothetical protein